MEQRSPAIEYASWGQRIGAKLIDGAVLFAAVFVLALALYVVIGPDEDPTTDDAAGFGALSAYVGFFVIAPVYFALMHGRSGRTIGKRALGLTVRRGESLERVGYGRALGRAFVTLLFLITLVWIVDILLPLWDRQTQMLHDKVVDTVVVRSGA